MILKLYNMKILIVTIGILLRLLQVFDLLYLFLKLIEFTYKRFYYKTEFR